MLMLSYVKNAALNLKKVTRLKLKCSLIYQTSSLSIIFSSNILYTLVY